MADLTVFPIPQAPSNYNKLGKKIMIHDLTQPEATSTRLINFENIIATPVTYTELTDLITNNNLIEGSYYLLMNFQTIYDQMDFDNSGNLKGTLTTKTGAIEEIWVYALSNNQIASRAYSKTYPNDQIQYDWTYNVTAINGSPAKGRISERIDEWNNRTDYDHRVIKFIRYDDGAGNFTVINDNSNASQEFLTFGNSYATNTGEVIYGNYLGDFYFLGLSDIGQEYPNNVFLSGVVLDNISGSIFYNNTFSGAVNSNTFSGVLNNNTFSIDVSNNTFSGEVYFNTFSGSVYANTFSGVLNNNTFSEDVNTNTFSGEVNTNTFSGDVYANTFSGTVNNNTFTHTSPLRYTTLNGYIASRTIDQTTYPLLFGIDYEKKIFHAQNGNVYFRYFDGTNDVNTLIP